MYLNIGGSEDQPSSHVFIDSESHIRRTNSTRSKNSSLRFSPQSKPSLQVYHPKLERNAHSFRFSSLYDAKKNNNNLTGPLLKTTSNKSTQTVLFDCEADPLETLIENDLPTTNQDSKDDQVAGNRKGTASVSIKSKFLSIFLNYFVLILFILISAAIFNYLEKNYVESMFDHEDNRNLIRTVALIVNKTKCRVDATENGLQDCLIYFNIGGLFEDFPQIHKIWNDNHTFDRNLKEISDLKFRQAYNKINFSKSILFVSSVITTVGYGLFSPSSQSGRLFCIFLTMFGVPLSITTSSNLAQFLMIYLRKLNIRIVVFIANQFQKLNAYRVAIRQAYHTQANVIYNSASGQLDKDQEMALSQTLKKTLKFDESTKKEFEVLLSRDQLMKNGLVLTNRERNILDRMYCLGDDVTYCFECEKAILSENTPAPYPLKRLNEASQKQKKPILVDKEKVTEEKIRSQPTPQIMIDGEARNTQSISDDLSLKPLQIEAGRKYAKSSSHKFPSLASSLRAQRVIDRVVIARIVSFLLLIIFVLFIDIIAPAMIFKHIESEWTFLDSIYVATISMSTVGLGDLVPNTQMDGVSFSVIYEISLSAYLIFGTVLFMVILRSFHETFIHVQTQIDGSRIIQRKDSTSSQPDNWHPLPQIPATKEHI